MKLLKKEQGDVIVEATIVFPIMFFIIFIMIYAGNAYYQKCLVERILVTETIEAAARCGDPMLDDVENNEKGTADVQPYRYILGGMNSIETTATSNIRSQVDKVGKGFFKNSKPKITSLKAKFNNYFIYSTFNTEIRYEIKLPIRLLFSKDDLVIKFASSYNVPVSDCPEFIRNISMVEDYLERFGVTEQLGKLKEKITGAISKAKEWAGK